MKIELHLDLKPKNNSLYISIESKIVRLYIRTDAPSSFALYVGKKHMIGHESNFNSHPDRWAFLGRDFNWYWCSKISKLLRITS